MACDFLMHLCNLFSLFILFFFYCAFFRFNFEGQNYREEPKAIVFLSKLLILFQSCNLCFASNPLLSISQSGTMLTIKSTCSKCNDVFTWTSQPHMLGKFPAGNLLLSFAILNKQGLTYVPAHGYTGLSLSDILLPSTTFASSFNC